MILMAEKWAVGGYVLHQLQGAIPHDQLADGEQMTLPELLDHLHKHVEGLWLEGGGLQVDQIHKHDVGAKVEGIQAELGTLAGKQQLYTLDI